ncbi:MAG TPA: NAD(P)-dependent alcohol dehydrogenase [Microbacteriaceae bacterium]|nr:NAD(P)-dependent alcohol dehydrogenase [Microbacteriaceae bacterium]
MKALVQHTYGSADVLELTNVDKPVVGADDVLIRVHAAAVNIGDWHIMTGRPYLMRVMGFGFRTPKAHVRGTDVAGRVEAVGSAVTRFQPGDDVFGLGKGSLAEYVCARQDKIAKKPANLSFEQAASVPTSGITALKGLREAGKMKPGQRVLIIGAAGGVGSFAVQLAKAFGGHVTGVCSTTKVDLVRSLGVDDVIDYTRDGSGLADEGKRFDLILDTAGNRSLAQLRRALTPEGTLVIVGGEGGGRLLGGVDRLLRAALVSVFVPQTLRGMFTVAGSEDLQSLTELIEAGKVTPVIDSTFALGDAVQAFRHMEEGHARGKIIVTAQEYA